ncbi:MAG TPA: 16S rRNA (guanine(966)-N(2))-methyltransferase RsmD [Candidatus Hydrogenedens sp.]|nr:16S rRNA (guanine(966)-N(2))-methyltransferase RsmD [Candidatus Hydrogenedens sp.]
MRVIAGIAKGTKLLAPHGKDIRPTLDRVRTSLFDIIHKRIAGVVFLDLFAGTGANGIEALSRGAERAYFVEYSKRTIPYIEANLKKTHFIDKGIIIKAELPQDIYLLPTGMDIVFMDPPYDFKKWDVLLPHLVEHKIFAKESLIIVEHSRFNFPPEQFPTLKKIREEKYGDTFLSFYC